MSNILLIYIISIITTKIGFIESVIKFSIEINDEIFTLEHNDINNVTETFDIIKKNFYICEDKKDCLSCSFSIYEFANCFWDCDHNRCLTRYNFGSFTYAPDLKQIYSTCTSCDIISTENIDKNCDSRILVEENSKNQIIKNNNPNDTSNIIEYSKINFMGLLCRYNILNQYSKSESMLHLNITIFYRYINIYLELDYGLYSRHIDLKTRKNYDIDTVGVNSLMIYVFTPQNYETQPFSIVYSFKLLKNDTIIHVIIIMLSIIILIFSILLVLIFIEIYKGKIFKHGRREYILNVNTLIFNRVRYYPNLFKNYNQKCFFCGNIIVQGKFVSPMKCRKHIYHYGCLMKWVSENMLDKTNFFCPMCQNEQLAEISRANISRDDNNLLNTSNNNMINNNNISKNNIENEDSLKSNKGLLSNQFDEKISNITTIKANESNNINNEIIDSTISLEDKKENNNNNNINKNIYENKRDDEKEKESEFNIDNEK